MCAAIMYMISYIYNDTLLTQIIDSQRMEEMACQRQCKTQEKRNTEQGERYQWDLNTRIEEDHHYWALVLSDGPYPRADAVF